MSIIAIKNPWLRRFTMIVYLPIIPIHALGYGLWEAFKVGKEAYSYVPDVWRGR